MESAFYIAQRCLVFTVYPHRKVTIDEDALKKELRDKKLLFARYYTESQLVTPPPPSIHRRRIQVLNQRRQMFIGGIASGKNL